MPSARSTPTVTNRVTSTPTVRQRVTSTPRVIVPSGVEQVPTFHAALGELTATAAATVKHPAVFAAPLGALVGTATATVSHGATLAAPLGSLTGSATATVKHGATLAAPLGSLTAAATATVTGFSPVTAVNWAHAYWTEGTEQTALAYADGAAAATFKDEKASDDLVQGSAGSEPTWRAATAAYNNLETIQGAAGDFYETAFAASMSQPYTVVMVGNLGIVAGATYSLFDGAVSTAATVYSLSSENYHMNAGADINSGDTADTNPHLFTAYFNGASSVLELDGTVIASGNAGTNALLGFSLFNNRLQNITSHTGHVYFLGAYSGDARSDGGWASFEQWVEDHVGITIA